MSIPPANSPAAVTVVDITDPTCAGEGTELIDLNAVQLHAAPFHARRIIVRAAAACVLFHSTNHRVRTCTKVNEGLIAYVLFHPRAEGTINGIPVRPGLMLAIEPGIEINVVTNAHWETMTYLFPPDLIRAQVNVRQRNHEFSMPRGVEMLEVCKNSAQQLFNRGKLLVETAAEHASSFNEHQDDLAAIECDLVENLLATLGTTKSMKISGNDRTRQRRSQIVKIAEDFALSQNGTTLYVADLCQVTKVSERTLEYAFQEIMGLTPVAFLIRLRLHRVRQNLLLARPGSTTISREALKWGFWHFGEFSHAYFNCFGELPSDTLLRKEAQEA